ncbi:hypothetical protein SFUMM280S_06074 [Streptomyces fumanus]
MYRGRLLSGSRAAPGSPRRRSGVRHPALPQLRRHFGRPAPRPDRLQLPGPGPRRQHPRLLAAHRRGDGGEERGPASPRDACPGDPGHGPRPSRHRPGADPHPRLARASAGPGRRPRPVGHLGADAHRPGGGPARRRWAHPVRLPPDRPRPGPDRGAGGRGPRPHRSTARLAAARGSALPRPLRRAGRGRVRRADRAHPGRTAGRRPVAGVLAGPARPAPDAADRVPAVGRDAAAGAGDPRPGDAALACRESVRARPGRGLGRVGPYRHRGTCPALRPRAPSAAAGPSGQAGNRPAPHDDHAAPLAARRLVASGADAGAVGLLRGGRQRERAAGGGALPGLPGLAGAAGQGRRPSRVAAGARRSGGADPRRAGRPGDGHHVPRRVPQGGRRTGRRPGRPRPGPGRDPEHGGAGGVGADGGAVGRAAQCRLRGHGRRAPGGAAGHGGDAGSVPEHGPGACHLRRGAHRRRCPGHAPGPAVRAPGPPAPHPQRHSAARRSGRDLRHPARLRELPRGPGRTAHRRRADPHGQPDARVDQLRAGARCEPGRRSGPAARLPAGPVHRGGGPRPGRTAGAGPAAVRGRPDGPDQHDRAAGRVGDRPGDRALERHASARVRRHGAGPVPRMGGAYAGRGGGARRHRGPDVRGAGRAGQPARPAPGGPRGRHGEPRRAAPAARRRHAGGPARRVEGRGRVCAAGPGVPGGPAGLHDRRQRGVGGADRVDHG